MSQVDYVDVIQTHDIEFGDLDQVQIALPFTAVANRNAGHRCISTLAYPPVLCPVVCTMVALLQGLMRALHTCWLWHRRTLSSCWLQVVNEAIPALVELREKGVVRHIGITGLPLNVFRKVLDR